VKSQGNVFRDSIDRGLNVAVLRDGSHERVRLPSLPWAQNGNRNRQAGSSPHGDRFPVAIQPVLKVLPLTPLIDALRSVMLEGSSLSSQAARIAIMAAWGILSSFAVALKIFRWQ
jgi:hypothetical protein